MGIAFRIAGVIVNLVLAFLAVHVTIHPPAEMNKASKKRLFVFLGLVGLLMSIGQEIIQNIGRKHEEAMASSSEQRRVEQYAKLMQQAEITSFTVKKFETLLANSCPSSKESRATAQQCVTEIQKLRQEVERSGLQARTFSQPIEQSFLRSGFFEPMPSNPFEKLFSNPKIGTASLSSINLQIQPAESPQKHFSVSLYEPVSLSEKVITRHGSCGVDRYGLEGGNCVTEKCSDLCVDGAEN